MKDVLKIHGLTKYDFYNSYQASQRLRREILNFFKQLGILKDIKRHSLFRSYFTKTIKFIESDRQLEAYNLYKQVIPSLLKILSRKKIDTHYKDTVNIRTQNELHQTIMMKDQKICQKDRENNELQKQLVKKKEIIIRAVEEKTNAVIRRASLEKSLHDEKSAYKKLIAKFKGYTEIINNCKKCKKKIMISQL